MRKITRIVTNLAVAMLLIFASTTHAAQPTDIKIQNNLTKEHVAQFIQWLNSIGMSGFEKNSSQEIAQHFAASFQYIVNGHLKAIDAESLHKNLALAKDKYQLAYVNYPIKDLLIDGQKAAARYGVTFIRKDGSHENGYNTVIIEFNAEGKVKEFSQSFNFDVTPHATT